MPTSYCRDNLWLDSSYVDLNLLEKKGGQWVKVFGPFPGRLGKSGLSWGRGLSQPMRSGLVKKEGDLRSPAGVFLLGNAYGTVSTPKKHSNMVYRKITPCDLWVDDPTSPQYNQHIVLPRPASTEWELKQQMKLNDYHHSLKLFIKHNAGSQAQPAIPGAGSSIFFHIWRGNGTVPSAGCTTMSEENLRHVISWLNPSLTPVYILMPLQDYMKLRPSWQLP